MNFGMQTCSRQHAEVRKLEKKSDLSNSEDGMVINARWTGLSISEATDLLRHASLGFTENDQNRENIQ